VNSIIFTLLMKKLKEDEHKTAKSKMKIENDIAKAKEARDKAASEVTKKETAKKKAEKDYPSEEEKNKFEKTEEEIRTKIKDLQETRLKAKDKRSLTKGITERGQILKRIEALRKANAALATARRSLKKRETKLEETRR